AGGAALPAAPASTMWRVGQTAGDPPAVLTVIETRASPRKLAETSRPKNVVRRSSARRTWTTWTTGRIAASVAGDVGLADASEPCRAAHASQQDSSDTTAIARREGRTVYPYFNGSPSPAWTRPSAPRPTKLKAWVTIG